jgi:hypothetical protein
MSSDQALGQQYQTQQYEPRQCDGPSATCPAGLLVWLKRSLLGSLILAAAVLMERRVSGDLANPLDACWLAAVAIVAVLAARLARGPVRAVASPRPPITATSWSSTLACVVLASALSLPGSSPAGLTALWAIVMAGEGGWWLSRLRRRPAASEPADRPWIVQQARRDRHRDGHERVTGWIRVDVAASQRVAQVHVAFCPPLEQAPTIELRQTGGPPARLKLGQALAYGARFELKLPAPGPCSITLEYTATTAGAAPTQEHSPAAN